MHAVAHGVPSTTEELIMPDPFASDALLWIALKWGSIIAFGGVTALLYRRDMKP